MTWRDAVLAWVSRLSVKTISCMMLLHQKGMDILRAPVLQILYSIAWWINAVSRAQLLVIYRKGVLHELSATPIKSSDLHLDNLIFNYQLHLPLYKPHVCQHIQMESTLKEDWGEKFFVLPLLYSMKKSYVHPQLFLNWQVYHN